MVMELYSESFRRIVLDKCEAQTRELNRYSAPMPWIGMYIAAATLVFPCLMFADLVSAIRARKFWLPSKYCTLNAATLTLLGVVVKLLLDISSPMPRDIDILARRGTVALWFIVMGSFLTSLCSMDGKSLVSNMIALSIITVTVSVNITIQMKTRLDSFEPEDQDISKIIFILFQLVVLIVIALGVHMVKVNTEGHFRQKYEMVLNEERLREGSLTTDRLKLVIKKLWIIAVTSSPQLVLRNYLLILQFGSFSFSILTFIHILNAVLANKVLHLRTYIVESIFASSDYSWSIIWILRIQSIACSIGYLTFLIRLIAFINRFCNKPLNTERVRWWHTLSDIIPLQLQIVSLKCCKLFSRIYQNKIIFILVVIFLKTYGVCILLIQFILDLLKPAISLCYSYIVKLKEYVFVHRIDNSSVRREEETELDVELVHLAGYAYDRIIRLSKMEINMIYFEQHQLIQTGKRQQPKNLFQLLQRSKSFIGVNNFDHTHVESLQTQEPPSCWTLPVITLAKIAIALPQESNKTFDSIIKRVAEGLKYADLVDKSLEAKRELRNIRDAVKLIWLVVELDHKWLKVKPIMRTSHEAKLSRDILQGLANSAKNRVDKYKRTIRGRSAMDHSYWPYGILAANSMYRVSSTLLLAYDKEGRAQTTAGDDDGLLEKVLDMIADILSACLTNLPYVMIRESYGNSIGKAEDRARQVARWFGECEEILKLLESREVPQMDPEKALCIDEWQAFYSQGNAYVSTATPNYVNASSSPDQVHVSNASPSPDQVHVSNALPSPDQVHVSNASPSSPEEEHVDNASPAPEEVHVSIEIRST